MKTYFRAVLQGDRHRFDKFAGLLTTFLVAALTAVTVQAQSVQLQLERYTANDEIVVKVYFSELSVAHQISKTFEPRESRYESGYLVLQEQKSEILRLLQFSEKLNFTVVVDENATATEHLKALGLQKKSPSTRSQSSPNNLIEPQARIASNFVGIPGFECYRTVEETFTTAEDIVANHPNLASWTDIGDSWEKLNGLGGYDINVLRLTNRLVAGSKPTIFITSSIHAREYTTAELMTRFAEQLIADYGVDADTTWILDHTDIRLLLVANPDGRKKAETGILWRKNANRNYCSATSNNRGADLNRNFSFGWNCCNGSSGSQCNQTYRGASAASEPETQAVIGQLSSIFADARGPGIDDAAPLDTPGMYLDIHSSGRLLLWPWGFTSNSAPNGTQLQTLGRKLAFFNGHTPQQSIGLYPTDGTTTAYAYGELGLASYTYELGTEFFESCGYFENTLLPDNIPSLMYALKVVRAPYQLPAGPEGYGIALSPTAVSGVPAGTNIDLQVTFNDARYNNSNGSEASQDIASAEYYIDTAPWEPGAAAVAVPMSALDFSFDSNVEIARAIIDTTTLSEGRHTIYTRARDTAGNWGVVSAEFLTIDNDAVLPTTLFEDDFESDLGWLVNPNGSDTATTGQWQRANPEPTASGGSLQLGDTLSGSFDLVTGAAGGSAGAQDIDAGVTSIRSPDIDIPVNADDVELSLYYYLAHLNNATADDFFRVTVVASTGGSRVVLQEVGDANQDNASWEQSTISLNDFIGETVYIRFEAADAAGGSLVEAAVDDVKVTATLANGNAAPQVNAGVDRIVTLPANVSLNATVSDDGLPNPPAAVTTTWSQVSGPATVIFDNVASVNTDAIFSATGVYLLRIDASDGELSVSDEVQITVDEASPGNTAPVVDAGADQSISLSGEAALDGSVSDDGRPNPPATTTTGWSVISGPGSATFADSNAIDTTVSFTAAGVYRLRLSASDSQLESSDDIEITVDAPTSACVVEQDFEAGLGGWSNSGAATCSTGSFVLGTPTAVTNGNVVTQVGGDHTSGSGNALFSAVNTSAGSNDIDGGECIAESPVYTVSENSDLSVWYFHGQRDTGDDASGDYFNLEASLDGGSSWSTIASNGDQVSNAAWTEAGIAVPAGSLVKLRIGASDGAATGDLVEAGLDDLTICATP